MIDTFSKSYELVTEFIFIRYARYLPNYIYIYDRKCSYCALLCRLIGLCIIMSCNVSFVLYFTYYDSLWCIALFFGMLFVTLFCFFATYVTLCIIVLTY